MTEDTKIDIENMIDRHGLTEMLAVIAEISAEKAEHIRREWQDKPLALSWDKMAHKIFAVAHASAEYLG